MSRKYEQFLQSVVYSISVAAVLFAGMLMLATGGTISGLLAITAAVLGVILGEDC